VGPNPKTEFRGKFGELGELAPIDIDGGPESPVSNSRGIVRERVRIDQHHDGGVCRLMAQCLLGNGWQGTETIPCGLISRVGHDGRIRTLTRFLRLNEIAAARVLMQLVGTGPERRLLKIGKVASRKKVRSKWLAINN
jgi:hypothetical protein